MDIDGLDINLILDVEMGKAGIFELIIEICFLKILMIRTMQKMLLMK